jgi:UDP-glucuronate decarboxylase
MKKILVTGGAGFLGSHLCRKLLNQGNEVVCLDNLYTGRKINISALEDEGCFSFLQANINNIEELPTDKFDEIYNLACPASPPHYQKDPLFTTRTSVIGTWNLLELAKNTGARFLQASTSEVYGDPKMHPQPETYWGNVNPVGFRSCYDEGKRVAETLCFDFYHSHKVPIRVMRIFNTYGPHMDPADGRVVSNFIMQALRGDPITIYGTGEQTRSFCFVEDNIEGMIRVMDRPDYDGPINIGNPGEFTMIELANKVLELTGGKSELVYKDLPKDDPTQRRPDITKARELLNWEPKVPLEEGLKKTINYFSELI